MRIAFLGTPAFAVPSLQALVDAGHEIALVVAQPDKPSGRGNQLLSPPTIELAKKLGIPTMQPTKVRSGAFPERMKALELELAVVVAYGRILTKEVLEAPKRGCINVHASLLPRWRGAAPIQWSILQDDQETGVCVQQMVEALDAGDVLAERRIRMGEGENAQSLAEKLAPMGAECLVDTIQCIDTIRPKPQDSGGITLARILTKEDGRMDFGKAARALDCQVRGLAGWPGTFVMFQGQPLKILAAKAMEGEGPVGTLLEGERVACGEGTLRLLQVQLPNRKPVGARDFLNGARLRPGDLIQ